MDTLMEHRIESPTIEKTREELLQGSTGDNTSSHRVILYDDDWHPIDEVISQVRKATGYDLDRVVAIVIEAHTEGRAICYRGSRDECQRVARVLREIRLQVEVDCD